ncbi:MAG: tetratricopeptide repeat protein [Balneolaceae bacterium]
MIKIALLFFSLALISEYSLATDANLKPAANDSVQYLLDEAKHYFQTGEEEKALVVYLNILKKDPENYEALWNASFIYTRKGRRQADFSSMEPVYRTALEIADFCLDKHPDKPRSHYVFAVASAGLADEMPNSSERVMHIRNMKEHSYRASELDPDYAPAWHLKGVWHSKIANISRAQRFAARFVYGALPGGASNSKAEEYLKRAISMDPDVILFKLDLAQHYQESGQSDKAVPVLESVLTMQPVSLNDYIDMREARERYETLN